MKYKVRFYQDGIYEVVQVTYPSTPTVTVTLPNNGSYETQVYKGSLSDCEAYIRLHEAGHFD